jgi:hypothetical protein
MLVVVFAPRASSRCCSGLVARGVPTFRTPRGGRSSHPRQAAYITKAEILDYLTRSQYELRYNRRARQEPQ